LAVVRASESYECLKKSFADIIAEVNELHESKHLIAFGKTFDTEIVIGGDYKVIYQRIFHFLLIQLAMILLYVATELLKHL